MQVTQVSNIALNNLWIDNVSRSKAMNEVVEVNISFDTSFEDVELLRLELEKFVRHPDNSRDFQQDLAIGVGGVGDCDKLTLKVVIKHKSNWHNEAVRATRRSKFMCALALALKKVPIFGPGDSAIPAVGSFENPSYAVTVSDQLAAAAREKAEREADALRMVPHLAKSSGTSDAMHVSEAQAVEELTQRPPLAGMESNYGLSRNEDGQIDNRRAATPSNNNNNNNTSSTSNLDFVASSRSVVASSAAASSAAYRAEGIEQLRADLVKRNSTRGRRRAGEGVPSPMLGHGAPGFSFTQYDEDGNVIAGSRRQTSYDVAEQQGGGGVMYDGSAYAGRPQQQQVSPRVAEAARGTYSLYQDREADLAGSSVLRSSTTGGGLGGNPHAASSVAVGGSSLAPSSSTNVRRGARPRGASVSNVEDEQAGEGQDGRGARR